METGKYSFIEAENFTDFVFRTLVAYPLFNHINVRPHQYWKILLFKDNMNYGGFAGDEEVTMLLYINS